MMFQMVRCLHFVQKVVSIFSCVELEVLPIFVISKTFVSNHIIVLKSMTSKAVCEERCV